MSRNKTSWIAAALLSGCLLFAEDWSHLGFDSSRSRTTTETMGPPFSLDWSAPLPGGGVSSPVAADGVVIAATSSGTVRAYRETSGALAWQAAANDEVISTPLLARGRAYVPSTDRKIHVLRLADGAEISTIPSGGTEMSSPSTDGTTIYTALGFPNQHAAAYTIGGAELWRTSLEQVTYSSPAVQNGRVYVGCNSGRYYALDTSDGSIAWTFATAGSALLSSPLVAGDHVYLVPGGDTNLVYRVHQDPAQWATNWTYAVPEPAPLLAGLQMTRRPVSSPVLAGGWIVFLMRFDQYHDSDANWILDSVVMREYLVAVDPSGASAPWSPVLLGTKTVSTPNDVPQFGLCPSPAVISGPTLAVTSTLTPSLRLFDTTGTLLQTLPLDTPTRASVAAANTHLYVATEQTLYAFRCAANIAPPVVPSAWPEGEVNVMDSTPEITWTPVADAVDYLIRVDDDGEVLLDWDYETATLPEIPPDTRLSYAIRSRDAAGALSEWSPLRHFWVNRNLVAPQPPADLVAIPGDAQASLSWTASPNSDVVGYWLSIDGGPWTPLGNVTSATITGLSNNTTYECSLVARDLDDLQSAAATATVTPLHPVAINGAPWPTLEAAVAAAVPGDVIQLGVGGFTVSATLDLKGGVTLAGYAPHLTTISGPGLDRVIRVATGSGAAVVRRLTVTGGLTGIDANGLAIEVRNVILRHMNVGLVSPAGSDVLAVHCTVIYHAVAGLHVAPSVFSARNCLVMHNGTGVYVETGAFPSLTYNNVAANTADFSGAAPGAGSTSALVSFLADWREPDASPNVDAADPLDPFAEEPAYNGGRANQGAFGNTAWAAKSDPPPPQGGSEGGGGGGGGGGCGLLGLEALLVLLLARALRRP